MIQVIISGLIAGSIIAFAVSGLSLIFGVARMPHFAHGEALMLGGMVALSLVADSGLPLIVGIIGGTLAATALGVAMLLLVYYPMRRFDELNLMIAALAMVFIVEALAAMLFGNQPREVPGALDGTVHIFGAQATTMQVLIFGLGLVIVAGLYLSVKHTRWGRAIKAIAADQDTALLMGIPVRRYWLLVFVIGSALAGLGGALLGSVTPVFPGVGSVYSLNAFIVIIFAGGGSIWGGYIGALALGIIRAAGASYVSSAYVNSYGFILLLLVLLLRPQGLFGKGIARD
jgi:branched-chain amino acid transport system permease protein